MGGKKSRDKGKRGEREARDQCRKYWNAEQCIRSAQASGSHDADLLDALPLSHVEVKRHARIVSADFMKQAESSSRELEMPVVLSKEDKHEWLCTFRMRDSVRFVQSVVDQIGRPFFPQK